MAARLLDQLITLRHIASMSFSETARVYSLKHQEMDVKLGDDAEYAALKACLKTPREDLEAAQDRAWDLAHSLAEKHAGVHPWSLLMVALRSALRDEERYDADMAKSLDCLETYGVQLWDQRAKPSRVSPTMSS